MSNPKCEFCGLEHNREIDYFRCKVEALADRRDGTPIFHTTRTPAELGKGAGSTPGQMIGDG